MSYPSLVSFGIEENPLLDSPFVLGSLEGGTAPPVGNFFLLLNGQRFGLLNGGDLLLL